MPYADPEREREYQRLYWQRNGHRYRDRVRWDPPISRHQVLDEDVAQAKLLAELEARRIGHQKASERLRSWLEGERRWLRLTSSRFVIDGEPDAR